MRGAGRGRCLEGGASPTPWHTKRGKSRQERLSGPPSRDRRRSLFSPLYRALLSHHPTPALCAGTRRGLWGRQRAHEQGRHLRVAAREGQNRRPHQRTPRSARRQGAPFPGSPVHSDIPTPSLSNPTPPYLIWRQSASIVSPASLPPISLYDTGAVRRSDPSHPYHIISYHIISYHMHGTHAVRHSDPSLQVKERNADYRRIMASFTTRAQVRLCPAWKCARTVRVHSHPGTPTPCPPSRRCASGPPGRAIAPSYPGPPNPAGPHIAPIITPISPPPPPRCAPWWRP